MNEQIIWIVLKRLRIPFLVIIVTFSISIIGLMLIPGMDDAGKPYHFTFFDAFYFVSYMATTIGFGEAPYSFSYPQRIWVSFSIYLTVIGWFYGIGTIISLIQDKALSRAIEKNSFRKQVLSLHKNFYIILGYNSVTKSIINRLSDQEYRVVVLDKDSAKIDDLILENFYPHVPAFTAEATDQNMLQLAGIHEKNCVGIISLFENDAKNSEIATIVKLLNKKIDIIVKATSSRYIEYFNAMGIKNLQNPFEIISRRMYHSIAAPNIWLLEMWIFGHSLKMKERDKLPQGKYILCGYGRMGKAIESGLKQAGLSYEILDINADNYIKERESTIFGDEEDVQALENVGIHNASCIIAATKDDLLNLTIVQKAKQLNPNIFTIARENSLDELNIFRAAKVNKIFILEQILADVIYNYLARPLSDLFIREIYKQDDMWAEIIIRMLNRVTNMNPDYFELEITHDSTYALALALENSETITLGQLRRSRADRNELLNIVYLLRKRGDEVQLMPESDDEVQMNDQYLIVASHEAKSDFEYIVNNIYELDYVLGK